MIVEVSEKTFGDALPTLLLCRKAGGVTVGVGATLDAVRSAKGNRTAVILACDASDRTKKQVRDKCAFYSVPLFEADVTGEKLGSLLGTRSLCAAVAVGGRGPVDALIEKLTRSHDR